MAYCLCWQASLLHLRPCLDSAYCSFQRKPGCHSIGPSCLSSKICGGIGSLWQGTTQLVQVWSEKPSFLFPRDSWLQFAGHSHVQVESVQGKGLFETLYKQVLWNIHESVSWFLSQQHWSVPRHVILWQKMLVTLPVSFPSTALTISQNTQASEVCEVRSPSSLLSKSFLNAICRAQPSAGLQVYMGKVCFQTVQPFTSKYCGTFINHPVSWFLPQQH